MRKSILLLLNIAPLFVFSQTETKTKGELVIHGSIANFKEPLDYVYLVCLDGSKDGFDSAKVINDKYRFNIQTEVTTLITLYARKADSPDRFKNRFMLTAIVEPTTVMISSTDSFSNAKVSGSMAYIEYKLLEARAEKYRQELSMLYRGYSKMKQIDDKAGMAIFQQKIDSNLETMYVNVYYKYIKTNPSSILINYALNQYVYSLKDTTSEQSVKEVASMYSKLSGNDQNSYFGREIKKKIDTYKIRIGMMAPEIVQTDFLGKPVSLTSLKGKYVLLDFWASWCGPCRRDFPQVKELYKEYNKYGFEIIGISKDTDTTAYLKAIEKDGINLWANTLFNEQIMKSYFVAAIPVKILIDPKGLIMGIWRGGNDENFNALRSMIENNIKKQSNFQQ